MKLLVIKQIIKNNKIKFIIKQLILKIYYIYHKNIKIKNNKEKLCNNQ